MARQGNHSCKGFTLIEMMIGMLLLSIALLGMVGMMVYFTTQTSDNSLRTCVLDNALNALAMHKANNLPVATTFTCGAKSGTITMSQTTFPADDACADVTATASAGGRSIQLRDKVCNFQ
jgi:prepilin-type N-terminal cleavage/methylation domain-containing protein